RSRRSPSGSSIAHARPARASSTTSPWSNTCSTRSSPTSSPGARAPRRTSAIVRRSRSRCAGSRTTPSSTSRASAPTPPPSSTRSPPRPQPFERAIRRIVRARRRPGSAGASQNRFAVSTAGTAAHPASRRLTRRGLVDRERFANRFFRHLDLHSSPLFLQQHRDARVALGPAAVERFGHLLERDVGELHRYLVLAPQRRRQGHVLVGQPQRQRRGLELPRQELIGEPVERPPPATGALPHGLPERDGLDARLHTHRE